MSIIFGILWVGLTTDHPSRHPRISKQEARFITDSLKGQLEKEDAPKVKILTKKGINKMPDWFAAYCSKCHAPVIALMTAHEQTSVSGLQYGQHRPHFISCAITSVIPLLQSSHYFSHPITSVIPLLQLCHYFSHPITSVVPLLQLCHYFSCAITSVVPLKMGWWHIKPIDDSQLSLPAINLVYNSLDIIYCDL